MCHVARLGDEVVVSLYQNMWSAEFNTYLSLPYPAVFYWRKAWLIEKLFGKEVVVGELQAEPWVRGELVNSTFYEQEKTMTLTRLQYNIAFAKETGLNTFYLWGAEWWYQMKEVRGRQEFWQEAQHLF